MTRRISIPSVVFVGLSLVMTPSLAQGATANFVTGEIAVQASNQNLFPSVAVQPSDDSFVTAYRLDGVVHIERWDGIAWSPLTSFSPADVGVTAFGDDLHIDTDADDDIHMAFIGMDGGLTPTATRDVYHGFYDASANAWDFDRIESYVDPSGHVNPDDPKVHVNPLSGNPEVQWTVRTASVIGDPAPHTSLNYAVESSPDTWTVTTTHQVEGPGSAITNAVFAIGADGFAHSAFMQRTDNTAITPETPRLMYGTNATGTFVFAPIVVGDEMMTPGMANAIDLSPAGRVHIAYYDSVSDALHHITDEASPGVFVDEVVDEAMDTDLGRRCTIDVNASGDILIAYQDHRNDLASGNMLKTAHQRGATPWAICEVDNEGDLHARFIGAALNDLGQSMIVHDGRIDESDKRVLFALDVDASDANGDGAVNSLDIQLVILRALGLGNGARTDINNDGTVNAVDIQLIINSVLGI